MRLLLAQHPGMVSNSITSTILNPTKWINEFLKKSNDCIMKKIFLPSLLQGTGSSAGAVSSSGAVGSSFSGQTT